MDIGWKGILYIWTFFLWPTITCCFYLVWKKETILRKAKFFITSVALAYGLVFVGELLGNVLVLGVLALGSISPESPHYVTIVNLGTTATMITLLLLPVGSTHYLAKRSS